MPRPVQNDVFRRFEGEKTAFDDHEPSQKYSVRRAASSASTRDGNMMAQAAGAPM